MADGGKKNCSHQRILKKKEENSTCPPHAAPCDLQRLVLRLPYQAAGQCHEPPWKRRGLTRHKSRHTPPAPCALAQRRRGAPAQRRRAAVMDGGGRRALRVTCSLIYQAASLKALRGAPSVLRWPAMSFIPPRCHDTSGGGRGDREAARVGGQETGVSEGSGGHPGGRVWATPG